MLELSKYEEIADYISYLIKEKFEDKFIEISAKIKDESCNIKYEKEKFVTYEELFNYFQYLHGPSSERISNLKLSEGQIKEISIIVNLMFRVCHIYLYKKSTKPMKLPVALLNPKRCYYELFRLIDFVVSEKHSEMVQQNLELNTSDMMKKFQLNRKETILIMWIFGIMWNFFINGFNSINYSLINTKSQNLSQELESIKNYTPNSIFTENNSKDKMKIIALPKNNVKVFSDLVTLFGNKEFPVENVAKKHPKFENLLNIAPLLFDKKDEKVQISEIGKILSQKYHKYSKIGRSPKYLHIGDIQFILDS